MPTEVEVHGVISTGVKMAAEIESLEKLLADKLPASELKEVKRILYGKELRYSDICLDVEWRRRVCQLVCCMHMPFSCGRNDKCLIRYRLHIYVYVFVCFHMWVYMVAMVGCLLGQNHIN